MKMLIIAACLVNFGDDRGGVDVPQGDVVDVNKDTARFLADNDRALYVEGRDDHTKPPGAGAIGRYTADERLLKQAAAASKARKAETAPPPAGA